MPHVPITARMKRMLILWKNNERIIYVIQYIIKLIIWMKKDNHSINVNEKMKKVKRKNNE